MTDLPVGPLVAAVFMAVLILVSCSWILEALVITRLRRRWMARPRPRVIALTREMDQ